MRHLCGLCSPRPSRKTDVHTWATCDGCGIVTDCIRSLPEPVAVAAEPVLHRPLPARTRLVPSLRLRR